MRKTSMNQPNNRFSNYIRGRAALGIFALLMFIGLALGPVLFICGVHLWRYGLFGKLGSIFLVGTSIPMMLNILLLEFKFLAKQPNDTWGKLLIAVYNSAVGIFFLLYFDGYLGLN